MDYLIGIDLGSTSLKCVIYDLDGRVVANGSCPTIQHHPSVEHPEWTVWEPAQIWGGTASAIKEAISKLNDPNSIRAVAVTGMGMDGLPIDSHGNWLYPFISWHDPRTEPQLRWWEENIGAVNTFASGGNTLWPFSTALRILWMQAHEPEILTRTDKWLLIEDFLNFMLCGEKATDYSMASCTLLFDQNTRNWSDNIMSAAGIDSNLFCDAYPSGSVLGEVHKAASEMTGIPLGTPVVLGGHDYLCGALPVGAFTPGVVLDVTGTWEIILTSIPEPILTPEVQKLGVTVETHVAKDVYTVWGGSASSDMLEWYLREYGFEAQLKAKELGDSAWKHLMADAEKSPPGSRGVMFLPHMSAVGCPIVDSRSMGAFVGLSNFAQKGDLVKAIIEGLNYQVLDILTALRSGLDISVSHMAVVGGGTRNEFWMQNKADLTGIVIEAPDVEEATPLGAAILAGIGVGLYQDEQEAFSRVYRPGKKYEPDPEKSKLYSDLFQIYKQIYPSLKPINHQLYSRFRA